MKVTIFNLLESAPELVEAIKTHYVSESQSASVTVMNVEPEKIKNCIGCWNCWVKTPGLCVHQDGMTAVYSQLMASDRAVFLMPVKQGFLSGGAKTFIDRLIPIYHPYIVLQKGEMMHVERYSQYPAFEFYFDHKDLTMEEEAVLEDYIYRMSHHFRQNGARFIFENGKLSKRLLTERPPKPDGPWEPLTEHRGKYIVYNGSPRGKKGNSLKLANQVVKGLLEAGVSESAIELRHLVNVGEHAQWAESFHDHSHHLFIFPLYVHSMPGIVKKYFDLIEPSKTGNTQMAFFVQSGFSEGFQSYYLRAFLSRLPNRLNCQYGGTLIKGGMEALQVKPEQANEKLYGQIKAWIKAYKEIGGFAPQETAVLESPIYMAKWAQVLMNLLIPTGLTNFYWNMQLKKNGVYAQRFDAPYAPVNK